LKLFWLKCTLFICWILCPVAFYTSSKLNFFLPEVDDILWSQNLCLYILLLFICILVPSFRLLVLKTNKNSKKSIIIVFLQYYVAIHKRYGYFVVYARMMLYCRNFNPNTIRRIRQWFNNRLKTMYVPPCNLSRFLYE